MNEQFLYALESSEVLCHTEKRRCKQVLEGERRSEAVNDGDNRADGRFGAGSNPPSDRDPMSVDVQTIVGVHYGCNHGEVVLMLLT